GNENLVFRLTASDGLLAVTSEVTVVVRDAVAPPDCTHAFASPAVLWPPNHGMVPVTIEGVSPGGALGSIQILITAVTQDEPTNGLGDGDTAVDALIQPNGHVLIRAERSGNGNGRVYRIHFTALGGGGQSCS